MGRRGLAHWLIMGLYALGLLAVAGPAGAIASQVTVSDPSPSDLVPPRPPPPPRQVFLGASITTNSPGWSQVLRRSDAKGVLVLLVAPRSPAVVSGLVPGDVIVGVQDRRLSNDEQLTREVRTPAPNDLSMTVLSPDGARRTVVAHLQPGTVRSLSDFEQQRPAVDPSPVSRLLYARGNHDPRAAMTVLDQLIDNQPGFAPAHTLRAHRLLELATSENERSPARETAIRAAIDTAAQLEPESLEVHRTAARILASLGDWPGTERHAARAVSIDDASAQAHHLLGRARLVSGRPKEALANLHRAVELDPYAEPPYMDLSACYTALGEPRWAKETDHALAELRASGRSTASTVSGQPLSVAVAALAALTLGATVPLALRRHPRQNRRGTAKPPERSPPRPGLRAVESLATVALLSIGLVAFGQRLGLSPGGPLSREIVDHLIPAAAVLVFCGVAVRLLVRGDDVADYIFVMTMGVLLAGLWMTARHLALVADAFSGETTVEVAFVHLAPGPVTIIVGILLYRGHPEATWTTPQERRTRVATRARPAKKRRR